MNKATLTTSLSHGNLPTNVPARGGGVTSARELVEKARLDLIDLTRRNSLLNYRLLKARGFEMTCPDCTVPMTRLAEDEFKLEVVPGDVLSSADDLAVRLRSTHDASVLKTRVRKTMSDARLHIEEKGTNVLFFAGGFLEWTDAEHGEERSLAPILICPIRIDESGELYKLISIEDGLVENVSLREKLRQQNIELPSFDLVLEGRLKDYLDEVISIAQPRGWIVDRTRLTVSFFSFSKFQMYQDLDPALWSELEDGQAQSASVLQSLLEDHIKDSNPSFEGDTDMPADRAEEPILVCDADRSQLRVVCLAREGGSFVVEGPPGTGKSQTITNLLADSVAQGKSVLFVAEKQTALAVVKRRLDEVGLGGLALELHSSNANKRYVIDAIGAQLDAADGEPSSFDEARYEECRGILDGYSDDLNTPLLKTGLTPHQIFGKTLQLSQTIEAQISNDDLMLMATSEASKLIGVGDGVTQDGLMAQIRAISQFRQALSELPIGARHPLRDSALTILTASDKSIIRALANKFSALIVTLRERCSTVTQINADATSITLTQIEYSLKTYKFIQDDLRLSLIGILRVDPEIALPAVEKCLSLLAAIAVLKSYYSHAFDDAAWSSNAEALLEPLKRNRHSIFASFKSEVRGALEKLKSMYRGRHSLGIEAAIGFLEAVKHAEDIWKKIRKELVEIACFDENILQEVRLDANVLMVCQTALGQLAQVSGARQNGGVFINGFAEMSVSDADSVGLWVRELNAVAEELDAALKQDYFKNDRARNIPLCDLNREIDHLETAIEELGQWITYRASEEALQSVGLMYVPSMVDFQSSTAYLADCVEYGLFEALSKVVFATRPRLVEWTGAQLDALRGEYIALENSRKKECRCRVIKTNRAFARKADSEELGILHREMHKKRKLMPLRKMFSTCGGAILAIKPIFMMSPLSVASYFPRTMQKFDLVIFDEASQVRPADAFGAILRGRQLIVVGDTQQLPPTNFFETLWDDEQPEGSENEISGMETPVTDVESILALMRAMRSPATDLRMHYRSKHESLIAVSNAEFYKNRLLVCPNPGLPAEDSGLHHHLISDAVYERGKSRTNPIEAQRIAQFAIDHMRSNPSQSLGVVAFSVAQQEAIEFAFDAVPGGRAVIEKCNKESPNEHVFIRNLETVQGDERDVILISIGYGFDADGRLTMSFGPLTSDGGNKRLNVLISRAKSKCHVFSNFSYEQLDTSKATYGGVEKLKKYLKYAQTGILENPYSTGQEPDSPFEEHVGAAIRALGYEIEYQVGTAGFRIDIGVYDPGNKSEYILGVECDGATYHSSRSARQRDKVRQLLLEQRGWKLHRIWSTDWFRSQFNEENKLKRCLSEATGRSRKGST